jgi:hypothetical protein
VTIYQGDARQYEHAKAGAVPLASAVIVDVPYGIFPDLVIDKEAFTAADVSLRLGFT